MPRKVASGEIEEAISLMTVVDENGDFKYGQREVERMTNLSRPFIRKIAQKINRQFDRNGIEIKGVLCMCYNCGTLFRKAPSKIKRAKNQFCDEYCKLSYMKGPNHPGWKTGKSANTFSSWVKNQAGYQQFREEALNRAGYKCEVSGDTEELDVHHISPKALDQESAFDPNNAIVLSKKAHRRIHEIIREGKGFEEAVAKLKEEYNLTKE